jgi:DNA repair protein RadD
MVNQGMATTGFDYPPIDLIIMLRPTLATGLWVQMLGRGTRPSKDTNKLNCLVLDFAGNTKRLGPINDPVLPRKRRKGDLGDAPVKICSNCAVYNHASARFCGGKAIDDPDFKNTIGCGHEFKFETKIFNTASTNALIKVDEEPIIEYFNVDYVTYGLQNKRDTGMPMMKVTYHIGTKRFNEYICLEHTNRIVKNHARNWWLTRHGNEPPETTREALLMVAQLRKPLKIRVHTNKQYPEILNYEW